MKRPLGRLVGLIGVGAMASQAGHLLVYQLQFGSAAAGVQSQGAHAYFPLLAKTSLGIVAAALLAGLLIVGAARLASGHAVRTTAAPPLMPLLSSLFTVQIACFVVQETLESLITGSPAPHVIALLFIGSIGQLPVALAAALAIKWLATRFEAAVVALRPEPVTTRIISLTEVAVWAPPQLAVQMVLAGACPASFVKRGPPGTLRS